MPEALFVTNSSVLQNVAAIHCPEISANHQNLAVISVFGCSFWNQFVLVLIWGLKSIFTPFSPIADDRAYGVWVWISISILENSVSSVE